MLDSAILREWMIRMYQGLLAQYGPVLDLPKHIRIVSLLEGNTPPIVAQKLAGEFEARTLQLAPIHEGAEVSAIWAESASHPQALSWWENISLGRESKQMIRRSIVRSTVARIQRMTELA